MTHLFIFGDSIAQGYWDPLGGWVQRVRATLDQGYFINPDNFCLTFNMGVSGNSTAEVLARFEREMSSRHNSDAPSVLLFAAGINDSCILSKDGKPYQSIEQTTDNIKTLINQARKYSQEIGFVGLNPVDETLVNPLPWDKNISHNNDMIYQYDQAIQSVCADESITFVPIWDQWISNPNYTNWLFDGLHPNEHGHQRIARAVIHQFLIPSGFDLEGVDTDGFMSRLIA